MSLVEFLRYAGTAVGINVIIGFLLSFVVEWFPEYEKLASRWKRLVAMGLSFVIPVGSVVILWLVGELPLSLDVVWVALSAGFAAFFGSQLSHARTLGAKRGRSIDQAVADDQRMYEMAGIVSSRVVELIKKQQNGFADEGELLFGK